MRVTLKRDPKTTAKPQERRRHSDRGARLPVSNDVPTPVPRELVEILEGAPTFTGAAFDARALAKALASWEPKAETDETPGLRLAQLGSEQPDVDLEICRVPIVLTLGRDLVLIGESQARVHIE
jgi:sirohydrochlorin ferrochelatase